MTLSCVSLTPHAIIDDEAPSSERTDRGSKLDWDYAMISMLLYNTQTRVVIPDLIQATPHRAKINSPKHNNYNATIIEAQLGLRLN